MLSATVILVLGGGSWYPAASRRSHPIGSRSLLSVRLEPRQRHPTPSPPEATVPARAAARRVPACRSTSDRCWPSTRTHLVRGLGLRVARGLPGQKLLPATARKMSICARGVSCLIAVVARLSRTEVAVVRPLRPRHICRLYCVGALRPDVAGWTRDVFSAELRKPPIPIGT